TAMFCPLSRPFDSTFLHECNRDSIRQIPSDKLSTKNFGRMSIGQPGIRLTVKSAKNKEILKWQQRTQPPSHATKKSRHFSGSTTMRKRRRTSTFPFSRIHAF